MDGFEAQRIDLARRVKWNIGFWLAGCLYWIFVTAAGALLPLDRARLAWFAGSFAIVPVAMLASRLFQADPKAGVNRLAALVGISHGSTIMISLPLVIGALLYFPQFLILVMAICYGLDFFVMSWAYGTKIPSWHAVVRTLGASSIWFFLPSWRMTALPAFMACLYAVTLVLMERERRRWLAANA